MIIRSRVDSTKTWKGMMGSIDVNNGSTEDDSNNYWGMSSTSDDQTSSTSYPFYVELDSSDGLMLGQHVYIERDIGQDEQKDGLWLSDYYIVDADTNEPYVWAANDKKKLEKRYVTLGKHDEDLGEYEIVDGLTKKDSIAFPTDALEEGTKTEVGDLAQTLNSGMEGLSDMDADYQYDDESMNMDDSVDMESYDGASADLEPHCFALLPEPLFPFPAPFLRRLLPVLLTPVLLPCPQLKLLLPALSGFLHQKMLTLLHL